MPRGRTRSAIVLHSYECEKHVLQWVQSYLPTAMRAKYRDSFDIIYNDRQIEVKASVYDGKLWHFNFHRHGVLNEAGIHAYILRLEGVPDMAAIHLVVPAPVRRPTALITMRSLLTYWSRFYNRIDYIEPDRQQVRLKMKSA